MTVHTMTINLDVQPNLQFRVDAFSVPVAARAEFDAAMRRNQEFIQSLPGFQGHVVFEKTSGPSTFDIVTIAVWESPQAIASAAERVRAYYQQIGFDMQTLVTRLGITASLGYYHAPRALQ
jgi:hypothetical protein